MVTVAAGTPTTAPAPTTTTATATAPTLSSSYTGAKVALSQSVIDRYTTTGYQASLQEVYTATRTGVQPVATAVVDPAVQQLALQLAAMQRSCTQTPKARWTSDRWAYDVLGVYATPSDKAAALSCIVFPQRYYEWAQQQLQFLQRNKPAAAASTAEKWAWCKKVVAEVSRALLATNVHPDFLGPIIARGVPNTSAAPRPFYGQDGVSKREDGHFELIVPKAAMSAQTLHRTGWPHFATLPWHSSLRDDEQLITYLLDNNPNTLRWLEGGGGGITVNIDGRPVVLVFQPGQPIAPQFQAAVAEWKRGWDSTIHPVNTLTSAVLGSRFACPAGGCLLPGIDIAMQDAEKWLRLIINAQYWSWAKRAVDQWIKSTQFGDKNPGDPRVPVSRDDYVAISSGAKAANQATALAAASAVAATAIGAITVNPTAIVAGLTTIASTIFGGATPSATLQLRIFQMPLLRTLDAPDLSTDMRVGTTEQVARRCAESLMKMQSMGAQLGIQGAPTTTAPAPPDPPTAPKESLDVGFSKSGGPSTGVIVAGALVVGAAALAYALA